MKILITGGGGFVGRHLANHLSLRGEEVYQPTRKECNLLDSQSVLDLVRKIKPEQVFHLAAQSLPGLSWTDPVGTFRVNVEGTLNLLEAIRLAEINPQIVVACSSSEYAQSHDAQAIIESDLMLPLSPYAVSKLAVDHYSYLYALRYKLNILRVRPFFLIGPGKVGDVCSDLAQRVVAVERGEAPDVIVGRLDITRDFLDIRDGVNALVLIAEKGVAGEDYNVCSGRGYQISDVLNGYKKLAKKTICERLDPTMIRPVDELVKVGNPAKLVALGWNAHFGLEESLASILCYWRNQAQ